jgi:signal transduction histidine kinase
VRRIAASLDRAPAPGTLQTALAATLKDPELRIAYWLESSARHVDAWGVPVVPPPPSPGRSMTRLLSGRRTIAVVSHATGALEDAAQLGPTVRLGLDNERLQAELLGRLDELRSSRTRIIATSDATRQQLERNLHDGVQQRLLSLVYEIRLAQRSSTNEGDTVGTTLLDRALAETDAAIDELRMLAHGLYPAILAESGLLAAVQDLADTSPFPVEVTGSGTRVPSAVEAAGYFAVTEALNATGPPTPAHAEVEIDQAPDRLRLTVSLGETPARATAATLDGVGALGGHVSIESNQLIVEIPCA